MFDFKRIHKNWNAFSELLVSELLFSELLLSSVTPPPLLFLPFSDIKVEGDLYMLRTSS